MAILDLPEFIGQYGFVSVSFGLGLGVSFDATAGGEILRMGHGADLFSGQVSMRPYPHHDTSALAAVMEHLQRPGEYFLIYNMPLSGPKSDPRGAILGAASPMINSVDATDARKVILAGLPGGYVLGRGDMVGYQVGSVYGLNRIYSVSGPASAAGEIAVQFSHPTVPGAAGQVAQLKKPTCKAVVIPGSFRGVDNRPAISGGVSFSWRQTLR